MLSFAVSQELFCTQELVLEELQTKFPHCDVLAPHATSIEFTSTTHDIEAYRVLLSPTACACWQRLKKQTLFATRFAAVAQS